MEAGGLGPDPVPALIFCFLGQENHFTFLCLSLLCEMRGLRLSKLALGEVGKD